MGTFLKHLRTGLFLSPIVFFIYIPPISINRSPNEDTHDHIGSNSVNHPSTHNAETGWTSWSQIRSKHAAFRDSTERCLFIKKTLKLSLEEIPELTETEIPFKRSQIYLEVECSQLTKAEHARYSMRLNLSRIKAEIIEDILTLIKQNPPTPKPKLGTEIEIANNLADAYIATVDDFLKTHPGARPSLGKRIEFLGLENEFNAPWCADWAEGMLQGMNDRFPNRHPIHQWFRFQWAQIRSPQHNFIVIYPSGNPPTMPPQKGTKSLLILDPWKTIEPRTYFPGESTWAKGKVPTNLGIE